jgi:hypothetical protein
MRSAVNLGGMAVRAVVRRGIQPDAGQHSRLPSWLWLAAAPTVALAFCVAAQQDEKHGLPFTAAMEWRRAATLFAPIHAIAERCWREWERIMHLPRSLAGPIPAENCAPAANCAARPSCRQSIRTR